MSAPGHGAEVFTLPLTEPVAVVAVLMSVMLLIPLVADRLRIPSIVGLILCGVILGPRAIGLLDDSETIKLLGTVGLQYILFMAGLEVDIDEFNKSRVRSLIFGVMTFVIPASLCLLVAWFMDYGVSASFLMAAMFAAHTLLAYPIVSKLGIAKRNSVTVAIGGTVFTDLAALLVLALVLEGADGDLSILDVAVLVAKAGTFIALLFMILPALGRWFLRNVASEGATQFIFVLTMVALSALGAHVAGLEPLIGSFLAGLALNRLIPETGPLNNRLMFVGNSLFIPCFLLWVGMKVDLKALFESPASWVLAGALLIPVVFSKWLAAWLAGIFFGYDKEERWLVFSLSIARAAATLAVALVGFKAGLFDETVMNAAVLMILITCMLAPWIGEIYGRRVARAEQARPTVAPKRNRVLVPLANPATAETMMDLGMFLHRRDAEGDIYPLVVVGDDDQVDERVAIGERMLSSAVLHAAAADAPVSPLVRVDVNPASGIIRAAKEQRVDTLLMGWSGHLGPGERVFGSVLDQVLDGTGMRVVVSRMVSSLAVAQRVVLAVPPFVAHEPDFVPTLAMVKSLAKELSAELEVHGIDPAIDKEVLGLIEQTKPNATTVIAPFSSWSRTRSELFGKLDKNDVLVLMSAREGTPAWQPSLDRLPRILCTRLPELNLLVVYPPLPNTEQTGTRSMIRPADDATFPGLFGVALADGAVGWETAVTASVELLHGILDQDAKELTELLAEGARQYTTQLIAGAALLHAHTDAVDEVTLLVGVHRKGLTFPRLSDPVHIVVTLLSPTSLPPQQHLRRLAAVAGLAKHPNALDRLRSASDGETIAAIVREATA